VADDEGAPADPVAARPDWLIPLALLALAALLVVLPLSRCGDGDPATATSAPARTGSAEVAATATTSAWPVSPAPDAAAMRGTGQVIADGETLLPLEGAPGADDSSLAAASGQDAIATAVPVRSVPSDEGFWVGSGDRDRIWVQLTGPPGESPYRVRAGDTVSFTATVVPNAADFPATVGVSDPEGAALLRTQGYHLEAATSAVTAITPSP
jgi:hypothetical protein